MQLMTYIKKTATTQEKSDIFKIHTVDNVPSSDTFFTICQAQNLHYFKFLKLIETTKDLQQHKIIEAQYIMIFEEVRKE